MAKRIRFSKTELDALREALMEEFAKELDKLSAAEAVVNFRRTVKTDQPNAGRVRVDFTPVAFAKMISLLDASEDEIAWHGLVENPEENRYVITDIMVYPQTVTGVTVVTDQEQYTEWLMKLPDEVFNKLHMQGHSHVRMATSPSTTDLNHQSSIVRQLTTNDFYIFMIFNKKLERNVKVYDMRTNTLYENEDVSIGICDEGFDQAEFLKQSMSMVVKHTPTVYAGTPLKVKNASKVSRRKADRQPGTTYACYPGDYDEDDDGWWSVNNF